jgi:hypothetical protein
MGRPSKFDPGYRPTPPVEPLRTLSEALLGCELKKAATRLTLSFDAKCDATVVHKTLVALQDSYKAPRE